MPPLALISSVARSIPFFQLVPTVAPPPDNSATSANLIGAPDCASTAPVNIVASTTPAKIPGLIRFPPVVTPLFYNFLQPRPPGPRCHAACEAAHLLAITPSNAIPISIADG